MTVRLSEDAIPLTDPKSNLWPSGQSSRQFVRAGAVHQSRSRGCCRAIFADYKTTEEERESRVLS